MNLIAAVDQNWAIGNKNELLVRIPADQKFFRETTTGKVVVMGRKTLESFPNGLPLKNRTNIVLTHDHTYKVPGAVVVHDMDELHEELKKYDSEDIYVIGGETIYRQLLDECDVAHITKIDYAYDADAYFPNLDERPEWKITAESVQYLRKGGRLLFEIGYDQGEAVSALMKEHFAEVRVIQDLAGLDRVVSGGYCG